MRSASLSDALRETLAVFDESGEPRTTPEVAEQLDLGRRSTYDRLDRLVERDCLETKKVGANARVWWRPLPTDDVSSKETGTPTPDSERGVRQHGQPQSTLEEEIRRISDGFFAVDDEWRLTYLNDAAAAMVEGTEAEALGQRLWDAAPELVGTTFETAYREAMETQEANSVEAYFPPLEGWYRDIVHPSPSGLSVYFTDVSERKTRQRTLERYERIVETVGDGIYVLDGNDRFTFVNDAFVSVTGYDREELLGSSAELVFGDEFEETAAETWTELESTNRSVAVLEERLRGADGESFVVESRFSRLELEDGERGRVGVVRDVTDRVEYERELEHQREQLAAVTSLGEVAREIVHAIIGQPTRGGIEETVCENLANSDSYLFAWIGEVDTATRTVDLRTEAGVEGYLDETTISVDPNDDRSRGPTGRAFRSGEVQTTRDVDADPRYEPWQDHVEPYGVQSSAAIPITHEGAIYGVLNVYAKRPYAFEGQEGRQITQLGEVIGHAIAAAERKQSLLSDELVELEFEIRDVFSAFGVSNETTGKITFNHTVPVGDGEFLVYGTATPDAVETVRELATAVDGETDVTVHSEATPPGFEIRVIDPPILSVVASLSGYVDSASIEDGNYQLTIHLAPSVDVHHVVDAVESAYPDAELHCHRQIARSLDDPRPVQRRLTADLTDRQHAVLSAAYYAGFFEWPREKSAAELADSLDIAAPTLHQHLRKGQRKVFDSLFSPPDGSRERS
ncbi:bacterio-opsin activator domain-containing protein [Natronococcus sp. A-GB7]|uniref:bacterio-opsin activator domain-containing protein n=1 Tax=Natronococcus sp. A-GB7 TaxID=3037649 RepID=UPI00241EA3E8|nr:bacterio-opsin activator domain-containing protein [Natronococcus sp. A-GB7]MDG5821500.1 bacterio-opsin activator domain-containing protein [Natronococcus sp. A-GB7]